MNDTSLYNFLMNFLSYELDGCYEINLANLADNLEYSLKCRGFCKDPYTEYDKALLCPFNKKRAKSCELTLCESYEFCKLLREEGYV